MAEKAILVMCDTAKTKDDLQENLRKNNIALEAVNIFSNIRNEL